MKNWLLYLFFALLLTAGCDEKEAADEVFGENLNPVVSEPELKRDIQDILESDTLKAITVYNSTSYFLYRGQPMGYEYEMLKRLADFLDVKLKIVLAKDINSLISMLNRGEGDVISFGLTITQERKKYIDFTDYLYLTRQVLVQRKPRNWRRMKRHQIQRALISDPIELIGDTVSIRRESSYFTRLINLQKEVGGVIHIDTLPGNMPTSQIIEKVALGQIKYTVADDNLAKINASYFPILDVKTPISFSQRIAWATRKNSPKLKDTINDWIQKFKKQTDYYVIYNKYFENRRRFKKRMMSEFYSPVTGKISPYDSLIKHHANRINWDWRLLASLIYQESRFDPGAQSWASAKGLMQIMPATARELGVTNVNDPVQSLRGGSTYLQQKWDNWESINDSVTRLKYTIASYNCGFQHVRDAQRLAVHFDEDEKEWPVVRKYLLQLSYPKYYNHPKVKYGYVKGIEPVEYVEDIFARYELYKQVLENMKKDSTANVDSAKS